MPRVPREEVDAALFDERPGSPYMMISDEQWEEDERKWIDEYVDDFECESTDERSLRWFASAYDCDIDYDAWMDDDFMGGLDDSYLSPLW